MSKQIYFNQYSSLICIKYTTKENEKKKLNDYKTKLKTKYVEIFCYKYFTKQRMQLNCVPILMK